MGRPTVADVLESYARRLRLESETGLVDRREAGGRFVGAHAIALMLRRRTADIDAIGEVAERFFKWVDGGLA